MRRSSHGQGVMSMSYDGGSSGGGRGLLSCYAKAKPRPSKWDDAQRWLSSSSSSSRRAPDDDRTLLPSASQKAGRQHSWGAAPELLALAGAQAQQEDADTKLVDAVLAYGQARCLSLRDVGTEMTPGGSKEPSRANTPRATAPAPSASTAHEARGSPRDRAASAREGEADEARKEAAAAVSPATAWDAAERAKHMARYRREEMKIQAWENRRRQKAELQMKMTEAKAEKMKLRAQEKTASKLASTQAVAKERRARAEAKLNQRAARVGDKADLLRRTGHLSSSVFSLKLPMMCS
ncbi:hypothetical protein QOZ80_2AG0136520 [Eleusine coracana subsp. coracana]|nr:hypothetical protein QOZ80_2AG0136520 [Eleusine coracana subsp. coracana]